MWKSNKLLFLTYQSFQIDCLLHWNSNEMSLYEERTEKMQYRRNSQASLCRLAFGSQSCFLISHPVNFKFKFTFLLSHIQHSFKLINILINLSFFERFWNFGFYQQLFDTGSCIKIRKKLACSLSLTTAHFERSLW